MVWKEREPTNLAKPCAARVNFSTRERCISTTNGQEEKKRMPGTPGNSDLSRSTIFRSQGLYGGCVIVLCLSGIDSSLDRLSRGYLLPKATLCSNILKSPPEFGIRLMANIMRSTA
jgi:hypothetical protein